MPLRDIWLILNRPCLKRLKPQIPEMIRVLKNHCELDITVGQEKLLLEMGTWTIDRLLLRERRRNKGLSGTKPSEYMLIRVLTVDFDNRIEFKNYSMV